MDALGRHAEQAGVARIRSDIIREVERCQPATVDALEPLRPDSPRMLTGLRQLPVAPDAAEGVTGQFYRLPHHFRSVCCALPGLDTSERLWDGDVVTFKGTEPLMPDFDDRWFRLRMLACVNMFCHTMSDFSMSVGPEPTAQPDAGLDPLSQTCLRSRLLEQSEATTPPGAAPDPRILSCFKLDRFETLVDTACSSGPRTDTPCRGAASAQPQ